MIDRQQEKEARERLAAASRPAETAAYLDSLGIAGTPERRVEPDRSARAKHDALCTARRHTDLFMFVCTCGLTDREVAATLAGRGTKADHSSRERFTIRWRPANAIEPGAYVVSIPNYDGGEVVPAESYDRLRAENKQLREDMLRFRTAAQMNTPESVAVFVLDITGRRLGLARGTDEDGAS